MTFHTRHAAVLCILMFAASVPSRAQARPLSVEQLQIVNTVKDVYAAIAADDRAKFREVVEPTFYMFDGGERYDGDSIVDLIKQLRAAGKHYEWSVVSPDVHINGNEAWIAYVNRGSVTDAAGKHDLQWLESAILQKETGKWKVVFMQSTRVPPPVPSPK